MTDFHASHPFALGGGLNLADAPELVGDGEAVELENVRFTGRNRWTFPRRPLRQLFDGLVNPCGTHAMPHGSFVPDGETDPIAIGNVILDWTGTTVNLYVTDGSRFRKLIGPLAGWGSVGIKPYTIAAVIGGAIWICDEGRRYGLTCYDPNLIYAQPSPLFQPIFKFDQNTDTPAAAMRPRTIEAYNNMLFAAGYGSESDPDRPEILRHSYIGFTPDAQTVAGGDAAKVLNPLYIVDAEGTVLSDPSIPEFLLVTGGVAGLFAVDDGFPVGTRGIPITGLFPGADRLVVATRFPAFTLYGFDRDSFQLELVDAERGCAAARAGGEADGIAHWWSPLGPCRWAGGRVAPIERKINSDGRSTVPRLSEINTESMWFLHQPTEYEARWYWDDGGVTRSFDYNYRYDQWKVSRYAVPLFAGGTVRPGTILAPAQPGSPPIYSLVVPANCVHSNVQERQATFGWTNGETGPEIVSEIERKKQSEATFQPVGTVASGVSQFTHTLLEPATAYDDRVRHRNTVTGQVSLWLTCSFTTTDGTGLSHPMGLTVKVGTFINPPGGGVGIPGYHHWWEVSWTNARDGVYTTVEGRNPLTGDTLELAYSELGASSVGFHAHVHSQAGADPANDGWQFWRARHTTLFGDRGTLSAWSDEATVSGVVGGP